MITFVAHLKVKTEHVAEFEALIRHVRDKVREHEPGVVYYDFARSVADPGTYVVIEVYRDSSAHSAHMASPWVCESIPKTSRLLERKPEIKQYVSPGTQPLFRENNAR